MKQAKSILPRLLRRGPDPLSREFDLVCAYWPAAVGPLLARHVRPVLLRPPTLVVEVADDAYLELAGPLREEIVGTLREELQSTVVRKIEFCRPRPTDEAPRTGPLHLAGGLRR